MFTRALNIITVSILIVIVILSIIVGYVFFINKLIPDSNVLSSLSPTQSVFNVGILPIEDSAPIIIADKEGLFVQEGLKVNITLFTSAKDRDIALQSGKIQIAISDPITSIIQFSQGLHIKIISTLWGGYSNQSIFYILAPPNSTARTLDDIKTIGISQTTIIEYATYKLLRLAGKDPNNYTFINIPSIPIRYNILMSGKIDAVTLPDPLARLAILKGAHILASTKMYNESITMSVLIANSNWLSNNKNVMIRFLRALNKAIQLIVSNSSKYNDLIANFIKVPDELKPYYRIGYWTSLKIYPKDNFQDVMSWLLLKNYIIKAVNYNDVVDTELVLNLQ
jgi:NitT/TauT family transport system substrate-binding protein